MTGCHLIIGINKDDPLECFLSHNNPLIKETINATNEKIKEQKDWNYYIFATKSTKIEYGKPNVSTEKLVEIILSGYENYPKNDPVNIIYLDDSNANRVEVEYIPNEQTLVVKKIFEDFVNKRISVTATTFKVRLESEQPHNH